MPERYPITPNQVAVLRALNEGVVELSETEVAVNARLLPNQVRTALAALEQLGLVNSWVPVTGRTGERLSVLTSEGQIACRALAQSRGTPPVGTIVRVRPLPAFAEWLSHPQTQIEIVSDD